MAKRGKTFIAPASMTRRILAFIIDLIIINLIIALPFRKIFRKLIPTGMSYSAAKIYFQQNPQLLTGLSTIFFIIGILVVLYFTYLEYKLQQTPGKMLLNLYIVPQGKISFWNYLLSNITFIPSFPFTLLWIIDPIYMFRSPKNQRFMEKISRILVVQKYKY